jgi:hypothetical protein
LANEITLNTNNRIALIDFIMVKNRSLMVKSQSSLFGAFLSLFYILIVEAKNSSSYYLICYYSIVVISHSLVLVFWGIILGLTQNRCVSFGQFVNSSRENVSKKVTYLLI